MHSLPECVRTYSHRMSRFCVNIDTQIDIYLHMYIVLCTYKHICNYVRHSRTIKEIPTAKVAPLSKNNNLIYIYIYKKFLKSVNSLYMVKIYYCYKLIYFWAHFIYVEYSIELSTWYLGFIHIKNKNCQKYLLKKIIITFTIFFLFIE